MAYDDGKIACTDSELVIRKYYFPFGTKRIPYSAIKEARQVPMRVWGKARVQGSGDFLHWFNFDAGRPRKDDALVIFTNARIRPVITPDNAAEVAAELTGHGVNVTTGAESGASEPPSHALMPGTWAFVPFGNHLPTYGDHGVTQAYFHPAWLDGSCRTGERVDLGSGEAG